MINTHAIVGPNNFVEGLTNQPHDIELQEGFTLVELTEPVRCWPEGLGKLYCSNVGELSFVDTRALAEVQADKWSEIKTARSAQIDSDLVTPFGVFQASDEHRKNITDAILLAQTLTALNQPVAIDWTLADNTVVTLNAEQMTTIGLLLGQKVQEAHAVARSLRLYIDEAETVEDVLSVAWPDVNSTQPTEELPA